MIVDVEKVIREYLPQVIHMSLATCVENKPWICEVHYAYDKELNFYFRSTPTRRHSLEIEKNPYVSGNIVKQHDHGQKPRGVYFEGTATVINDIDENHPAYIFYCERFGAGKDILDESRGENGHKFYKITVSTFYLFDSIESIPSKKYELNWTTLQNKSV